MLLVALSLGLSNFAAPAGIGINGIDPHTRLRVGVIFGIFETDMPILGLPLGRTLADALGHAAHWIGAIHGLPPGGRSPRSAEPAGVQGTRLVVLHVVRRLAEYRLP